MKAKRDDALVKLREWAHARRHGHATAMLGVSTDSLTYAYKSGATNELTMLLAEMERLQKESGR